MASFLRAGLVPKPNLAARVLHDLVHAEQSVHTVLVLQHGRAEVRPGGGQFRFDRGGVRTKTRGGPEGAMLADVEGIGLTPPMFLSVTPQE